MDEDVDGYGDGDKKIKPSKQPPQPTHLQPHHPHYFILTAYHSLNAKHHTSYHAHDNSFDNHLGNNAHAHVHDNAQCTVASTTASSPL